MANDPFLYGPPLLVPVDPVQVHEPVKVGPKVLGPHAGETLDVAADPRAQVVDGRVTCSFSSPCGWRPSAVLLEMRRF